MFSTSYDPRADAFSVFFGRILDRPDDAPPLLSEEVAPGIILDFDADGLVIAVEVLGVSQRMASSK